MCDHCNRILTMAFGAGFVVSAAFWLALPVAAASPPHVEASPMASQPCPTDPITGPTCAMGRIADGVGAIHDFASNPVAGFGKWVLDSVTGGGSDFLGRLLSGTPDFGGGFSRIWSLFLGLSWTVLGIALVFRLLKQALMESGRSQHPLNLLIDIGPRLLIFPAAAGVSYAVISALAGASRDIGAGLFTDIAAMAGPVVAASGGSMEKVVMHLATDSLNPGGFVLQAVAGVTMLCLLIYLVMLMAMRFVTLSFCIVIAPMAIMCGAYDTSNQVFQWWLRSTVGSLLIPVIMGAIGGVTVVMAFASMGTGGGELAADVFLIGGLWFMGKTVRHATLGAYQNHHFSGMLGAAEAGMLAWTRPMSWHKSVPGVQTAMRARGLGGAASGLRSRGVSTITDAAPAQTLLAPNTPFHNGFKRAVVENGILLDEVEGYSSAIGMDSQTTMAEKVAAYVAVPAHAEKVYATTYGEWITTGRIDHLNPANSTVAINNRYGSAPTREQSKGNEEAAIRGYRAAPAVAQGAPGKTADEPVEAGTL